MNIVVSGMRNSGASAVIDYLDSFEGCAVSIDPFYEHYVYTMPGSFVDLEDKLLRANDPHRSDEAIRTFLDVMRRLYVYNFGWFGSYKRYLGEGFWAAVEDFVSEIAAPGGGLWYGRYRRTRPSLFTLILQVGAYFLKGATRLRWGVKDVLDTRRPVYSSYVTKEEFCAAVRRFSAKFFELCRPDGCEDVIYDHLLWPHNADRADDFFGEDFRMIILRRDPRDIYVNQKYIWSSVVPNYEHVLPEDIDDYCSYIKSVSRGAYLRDDDRVKIVQFEDLLYHTEETTASICDFLGFDPARRRAGDSRFNPEISINNTQMFTGAPEWEREADMIAERLPELIYNFPYRRQFNRKIAQNFVYKRAVAPPAVDEK